MMGLKDLNGKLNGKKRYIASGTVALSIPAIFLWNFFVNWHTMAIANDTTLKTVVEEQKVLKVAPTEIASLKTAMEYIKEDVSDIKDEMKEQKALSLEILRELKK